MKNIIYLLLLIFGFMNCTSTHESGFGLNGTSKLTINNDTSDSVHVSINNWYYLPFKNEVYDTLIPPGNSVRLDLKTQSKHFYNLYVAKDRYMVFARPNKENIVDFNDKSEPIFSGEHHSINKYLAKRGADADWAPRTFWFQGGGTIDEMVTAYDSINASQKRAVSLEKDLPRWFKNFEESRLEYVNVESKLSALFYRKRMLSMNDSIPSDYLKKIVGDIKIESTDLVGVEVYMRFLSSYLLSKNDSLLENDMPDSKAKWTSTIENRIQAIEQNFSDQGIKDLVLSRTFTDIIQRKRHIYNQDWIKYIENQELADLVTGQLNATQVLPKGDEIPYFYLSDKDSVFFEPDNFKGKVTLINFWATWCKPCYKEFEHENVLVEQYVDEPVAIVNICIESEREKWLEVVDKQQLKTVNLFATKTWSEKINHDFETTALPHSILIDAQGKVIANHAPRPSAGIDDLITKALKEGKHEKEKDVVSLNEP